MTTDTNALEARKRKLLAEVERIDAQLKEGEIDYEAWRAALEAYYNSWRHKPTASTPFCEDDKRNIRYLIAALPLAPISRAAMGEREIERLLEEAERQAATMFQPSDKSYPREVAMRFFALRRVPGWPGEDWPSDARLQGIAGECALAVTRGSIGVSGWIISIAEQAALEMARRLKARMDAGGEA